MTHACVCKLECDLITFMDPYILFIRYFLISCFTSGMVVRLLLSDNASGGTAHTIISSSKHINKCITSTFVTSLVQKAFFSRSDCACFLLMAICLSSRYRPNPRTTTGSRRPRASSCSPCRRWAGRCTWPIARLRGLAGP